MITPSLRVLIVDDHARFRELLRRVVESRPDLEYAGAAADGTAALARAEVTRPHVVLMDLHMPGLSGIDATRELVRRHPLTRVLILTATGDERSVVAAIRAGARGYLLKDNHPDDIARAISEVARGSAVFGPEVADPLLCALAGQLPPPNEAARPRPDG